MQMKFFSFSPAQLMYKEWSGLYENEKGKLYINDGIGCVGYLARIGARPEITVIELHRRE
jgi:predicted MPP superfamily phosphohydrolase